MPFLQLVASETPGSRGGGPAALGPPCDQPPACLSLSVPGAFEKLLPHAPAGPLGSPAGFC